MKKLLVLLTSILILLSTVVGNIDCSPADSEIQHDAFVLVNEARLKEGLQPLIFDSTLTALAEEHCLEMVSSKDLNHDGFDSRYSRSGYGYAGENVAQGYHDAKSLVDGWLASPGHRANIMSPNFTHSGLSYVDGYACQLFGG